MADYLLDTNHASWLMAHESPPLTWVQRSRNIDSRSLDAQIAAVARINGLMVLTADHHFQYVEHLSIENWQSRQLSSFAHQLEDK